LNGGNRCCRCLDEDGAGARGAVAFGVCGDVVDGVGGDLARVDHDVRDERAVEESLVAEVCVSRLAGARVGHGRTKISVAGADLNDGRVVAVEGDGRRGRGGCAKAVRECKSILVEASVPNRFVTQPFEFEFELVSQMQHAALQINDHQVIR